MRRLFAVTAVYCLLAQALGVYCYPNGRWDSSPVSVDAQPARLWNWVDNPIVRTARGGFVWQPYSIVAAVVKGGWPAGEKRMRELGINSY